MKKINQKSIIKIGCKTDNKVDSIEWCTQKENVQHSWKMGLSKVTEKKRETARKLCRKLAEKSAKPINQYDLNNNFIRSWISGNEASRQLNINQSTICLCCNGKRNKAGRLYMAI